MPEDKLLSLQDVAQQTGMSEATVRRWVRAGQLPAVELGGRYRISQADLQNFLDKHRKQPPQDKET
jgi:excisionase family DNA binding protein